MLLINMFYREFKEKQAVLMSQEQIQIMFILLLSYCFTHSLAKINWQIIGYFLT